MMGELRPGRRTRPGEEPELRRALEEAKRAIEAHFRPSIPGVWITWHGAIDLYPGSFAFWVCTSTDAERDTLLTDPAFEDTMRSFVLRTGYPPECARWAGFTAQSQETVDRKYGGNWYHAMK